MQLIIQRTRFHAVGMPKRSSCNQVSYLLLDASSVSIEMEAGLRPAQTVLPSCPPAAKSPKTEVVDKADNPSPFV